MYQTWHQTPRENGVVIFRRNPSEYYEKCHAKHGRLSLAIRGIIPSERTSTTCLRPFYTGEQWCLYKGECLVGKGQWTRYLRKECLAQRPLFSHHNSTTTLPYNLSLQLSLKTPYQLPSLSTLLINSPITILANQSLLQK